MALQRVRSLATTKFTDETVANAYVPAAGEMISIFVHGTYRGLRIGDGTTVGGLSLVNSGSELYEYIGEAPPEEEAVLPTPDAGSDTGSDTGSQTWAQQQTEQLGEATVASELFDATFYGMNSLLFDGSSYLSRTFGGPTDASTWTYSFWVKRTMMSSSNTQLVLWTEPSSPVGTDDTNIGFTTSNKFQWYSRASSSESGYVESSASYRDTSTWYHFVVSFEPSSMKFYANGDRITALDRDDSPSSAQSLNTATEHRIGNRNYSEGYNYLNARMANIQFIDGMALDASYFGQYMGANWAPKKYEGAYGANGFWLDFSDTEFDSGTEELVTVKDVSGNGNHWQAA